MNVTIMNWIERATKDGNATSRDQGAKRSRATALKL